jgi:hypothetical protein
VQFRAKHIGERPRLRDVVRLRGEIVGGKRDEVDRQRGKHPNRDRVDSFNNLSLDYSEDDGEVGELEGWRMKVPR